VLKGTSPTEVVPQVETIITSIALELYFAGVSQSISQHKILILKMFKITGRVVDWLEGIFWLHHANQCYQVNCKKIESQFFMISNVQYYCYCVIKYTSTLGIFN